MSPDLVLDLDPRKAPQLVDALKRIKAKFEGPDEVKSLDGATIASVIVVVTPVVAKALVQVIMALKGSAGRLRVGTTTLEFRNMDEKQLRAVLEPSGKRT